ncbi:MAG TPA: 3-hydroxyacyl-ACP dehydratase FabZ family protein [Pseudolabrys sp.]|jgi:3-hydroxyacyl-[acyl-carrier-protein] dehydratase
MRLEHFQLIDRIIDISVSDRKIRTEATVPSTNTIFEGHFPGFPLMPGVLLIETMAQTSGWLVVAVNRFERMAFLAAVKDAKFRMFVTPGQKLSVTAALLHEGSGYAVTQASIALGGKSICDATLTLRVMDFPNHEMRLKMRETAARVGFPAEVPANG